MDGYVSAAHLPFNSSNGFKYFYFENQQMDKKKQHSRNMNKTIHTSFLPDQLQLFAIQMDSGMGHGDIKKGANRGLDRKWAGHQ